MNLLSCTFLDMNLVHLCYCPYSLLQMCLSFINILNLFSSPLKNLPALILSFADAKASQKVMFSQKKA